MRSHKKIRHSAPPIPRRRQKAGGDSASYCIACGKPLTNSSPYEEENSINSINADKTEWMNRNIGFDSEHSLIVNLGEDDFNGIFEISDTQLRATNGLLDSLDAEGLDVTEFGTDRDGAESISDLHGFIMHRDCVKVMKLFGLDVTFELVNKLHESCTTNKKYQGQFYKWEEALEEDESNYMSPLESKEQRAKLMQGCSAIEEVRNAPGKEKERRQRIVNQRRFARTSRKMNLPTNIKNIVSSYLSNTKKNARRTNAIRSNEILNVYEENNNSNNSNNSNKNKNKNKNKNNEIEPAGGAGRKLRKN
jgi:hypothetical protein